MQHNIWQTQSTRRLSRSLLYKSASSCGCKLHNSKHRAGHRGLVRAEPNGNGASEEVIQRLRKAEEEAAELRKQLAAAGYRAGERTEGQADTERRKAPRIDGTGLSRENPFAAQTSKWLSESEFFARGPGESTDGNQGGDAATVRRRLLIGTAITVAAAAFALVPTDALRIGRPSKPLFFYLIPLVRVQDLLAQLGKDSADGNISGVQRVLERIQGPPNTMEQNLRDAAAGLSDGKVREKAGLLARDIVEYVAQIDYNKYFEALGRPGTRGGAAEKLYADFSLNSIRAAQMKLRMFLALMPPDQIEAAKQQASPLF